MFKYNQKCCFWGCQMWGICCWNVSDPSFRKRTADDACVVGYVVNVSLFAIFSHNLPLLCPFITSYLCFLPSNFLLLVLERQGSILLFSVSRTASSFSSRTQAGLLLLHLSLELFLYIRCDYFILHVWVFSHLSSLFASLSSFSTFVMSVAVLQKI